MKKAIRSIELFGWVMAIFAVISFVIALTADGGGVLLAITTVTGIGAVVSYPIARATEALGARQ